MGVPASSCQQAECRQLSGTRHEGPPTDRVGRLCLAALALRGKSGDFIRPIREVTYRSLIDSADTIRTASSERAEVVRIASIFHKAEVAASAPVGRWRNHDYDPGRNDRAWQGTTS